MQKIILVLYCSSAWPDNCGFLYGWDKKCGIGGEMLTTNCLNVAVKQKKKLCWKCQQHALKCHAGEV